VNAFDIAVIVMVGIGFVVGVVQGLVRILVGIAALVVAFVLSCRFHAVAASWFAWTGGSEPLLRLLGYLTIFFGVMLAGGAVAWLARKLMKAAMLGWADRLSGGAMGLLAAVLALALLVLPVVAYAPSGGKALVGSRLARYLAAVADVAITLAPPDLARRYGEGVQELRRRWAGVRREVVVRMRGEGSRDVASDPPRGS